METIRFTTRISKSGTIRVPKDSLLIDKDVEVYIKPAKKIENKQNKAMDFVIKWAGFMSDIDVDSAKFEHIMEKHK